MISLIFGGVNFQTLDEKILFQILIRVISISAIIIGAYIVGWLGKIGIHNFVKKTVKVEKESRKKRRDTLTAVFSSAFSAIVWVGAFFLILVELGLDPAPLLAGVGLFGLAVGIGARSLIQDYISGIFIITEDQYRVGEDIKIADTEGVVINLSFRKTILEDKNGVIHFIPNGQVNKVSNFSRKEKKLFLHRK